MTCAGAKTTTEHATIDSHVHTPPTIPASHSSQPRAAFLLPYLDPCLAASCSIGLPLDARRGSTDKQVVLIECSRFKNASDVFGK